MEHAPLQKKKLVQKGLFLSFINPLLNENFLFLCDKCLTEFEMNKAKTENDRLTIVEKSISLVKSELTAELNEIKTMLKDSVQSQSHNNVGNDSGNIWFDADRLAKTKVPPSKPMLILSDLD